MGIISEKTIDFLNILGGNSILITCINQRNIKTAIVDKINNILFIYDESENLNFFSIKLNKAKTSSNECYPIYKIETFSQNHFNENNIENNYIFNKNSIKIQIFGKNLFLCKGNFYILVLDLDFSNKNPEKQRVVFYKEFLINLFLNEKKKSYENSKTELNKNFFKIFKKNKQNQNDFYILYKISEFEFIELSFSQKIFLKKNYIFKDEHCNNFDNDKKISNFNYIINMSIVNLNFFNFNESYISNENYFFDLENNNTNYINKKSICNEKFITSFPIFKFFNELFNLRSDNDNNNFLYISAILIILFFCFFLRIYKNRLKKEKIEVIKKQYDEINKLNLDELKTKSEIFNKFDTDEKNF
jgi:hypothetical protein